MVKRLFDLSGIQLEEFKSSMSVKDYAGINIRFALSIKMTYKEKMRHLIEFFGEDAVVSRGILDSYRRKCTVDEIFGESTVMENFEQKIINNLREVEELVQGVSGVVIADTAYDINSKLISMMIEKNKKVFAISPNVGLNEVRNTPNFITTDFLNDDLLRVVESLNASSKGRMVLENILTSQEDKYRNVGQFEPLVAGKSYRNPSKIPKVHGKKILFLHCMRDAAAFLPNLLELHEPLDYIEWAEVCLSVISRSQEEWVVKIHPHGILYQNESEILKGLFEKYEISPKIIDHNSDRRFFFGNENIIFTHSGTVGFESAFAGWKVQSMKGRFNSEIAVEHQQIDAFTDAMRKSPGELLQACSGEGRISAGLHLFLISKSFLGNFKNLYPKKADFPILEMTMRDFVSSTFTSIDYMFDTLKSTTKERFDILSKHPIFVTSPREFDPSAYANYITGVLEKP